MKATIWRLCQRAGGRCEPVQKKNLSTFGVSDESHRVVSFSIRLRGRNISPAIWVATRKRQPFVPCVENFLVNAQGGKAFLFYKNTLSHECERKTVTQRKMERYMRRKRNDRFKIFT